MTLSHRHHARCACAFAARGAARPFTLPGTTRKYERNRPFTIEHIALDLALDIAARTVMGSASLDLVRVDGGAAELRLDAVSFTITTVQLTAGAETSDARYHYDGDTISISIPESISRGRVTIKYSARPRRGLYFLAPDEHVQKRPTQVWSQCQDEDARAWFPCHDKPHLKQTTELRVRVPKGWYALSNGTLLSRETRDDGEIFHWRQGKPHPSYLVTLAAGEFAILDGGSVGATPLTYLVPRGSEEDGRRTFKETPGMVALFSRLTGVEFPWDKYAQVVVSDFIFGGMENTSATTMYEHILLDSRAALDISSDDLIAHELAHQWFGDYVTCRDWSHGWLNEGFATYLEHIEREHRLGLDEYEYGVKSDQDSYLGEAASRYQRPIVCQDYEEPIDLFDRHLYEKGGLVLHMLRRELGDEVFWRGVGAYLKRHAFGVVETRDLMRALEEVSGRSLERFFEQWVFKAGHPCVDIKIEHGAGTLVVEIKQTQRTSAEVPLFAFDVEIDIYPEQGDPRREVLRVESASETFVLPEAERPRFLVVDPRHLVVGDVAAELPADMNRRQLAEAPSARGRWLAAQRLARREDEATVQALARSLGKQDEFWGVRAEAAYALGALRSSDAMNALLAALPSARHPKVRRAVASSLGKFTRPEAASALQKIALQDESYLVESEAARALGATRQPVAFDTLVELLDRPAWADVVRAGAIDGLAALRDDRALPHLMARTRYGNSTRSRRAAIRALPRASTDRRTREALEELLDDSDPHLRVDVAIALGDLGDSKARPALNRALDRDLDGRVRRRIREVLRDMAGGGRAEQLRLQEEVDKLRADLAELRNRLTRVEGRDQKTSASGGPLPSPAAPSPPAKPRSKPAATGKPRGKAASKKR